jgi:hypothetical protein
VRRRSTEWFERLEALDAALPATDGVACFNRMYLKVTKALDVAVEGTTFEDDRFLSELDVRFANLFFDAVAADQRGEPVPIAWRPVFRNRARPNTLPLQFALASMAAHINHDLVVALDEACDQLCVSPDEDTPQFRDFDRVNEVIGDLTEEVKSWFMTGVIGTLDDACGRVDDAFALWSMRAARRVAWENAQMLCRLRDEPLMRQAYVRMVARAADVAARGMLI